MTHSGLLRVRSVEGLAEMQNVVLKQLAAGEISAAQALDALQSLKRLSAGDAQGDRPAFSLAPRRPAAMARMMEV